MAHVKGKTLFGAGALAMGALALATQAPGAWAASCCWGLAWAAASLWGKARGADARVQSQSLAAQEAFARGVGFEREPGDIKSGAVLAILAMLCALLSALAALGAMAAGLGWTLLAAAPLIWAAIQEARRTEGKAS